ncbi:trypsin delta-like, partial [Schistocerca gregaria]|uniref:trypsin delta-like n=1 Tax=Schistocerca gregaria TaxID=7010 RepID=UPI00211F4701
PPLDGRIVGGEAVDISQYPWQLSLQKLGSHSYGASIISSDWALTAAHCSLRNTPCCARQKGMFYGRKGKRKEAAIYRANGSLAVARLPVGLGSKEPSADTPVTITGWGALSSTGSSPIQLQAVTTYVVDRASCNLAYNGGITQRLICAGEDEGGKDSCQGDSGGPLVEGSTQYGIVSWGRGCAQAGYPGVYANMANLRSWVTQVTGM